MAVISDVRFSAGNSGYTLAVGDPYLFITQTGAAISQYNAGIYSTQGASKISVAGFVQGYYGIWFDGIGISTTTITATGSIFGESYGIVIGNADSATPLRVYNDGAITSASGYAIYSCNTQADDDVVQNNGIIRSPSTSTAIALFDGDDKVVNTGTIIGSVDLGDGNDVFDGRLGHVSGTVNGGTGADTYYIDKPIVIGESGTDIDTVYASVDYTLAFRVENLVLEGSALIGGGNSANNDITGNDFDNSLYGYSGNDLIRGYAGIDLLSGGNGDDRLFGDEGDDKLVGGNGDDTLTGGDGNDTLSGGAGDDIFLASDGGDTFEGSTGFNTVSYAGKLEGVTVSLEFGGGPNGDDLQGISGVIGTAFADMLTGSEFADRLEGGAGGDKLTGGEGNDTLAGGAGADRIDGGAGIDTADYSSAAANVTMNLTSGSVVLLGETDKLYYIENAIGGNYGNTIIGNTVANTLIGGAAGDTLSGGNGNDTLTGGAAVDLLTGGAGNDRFVYADIGGNFGFGNDIIADFVHGQDRIDLTGVAAVDTLSDLTISQSGANTQVLFAGGTTILLQNVTAATLTAGDFLFA